MNQTQNDPKTRTECSGCFDPGCAVCEPHTNPGWQGRPSQTHAQRIAKASDKQVAFLVKLGADPEWAASLNKTTASEEIDRRLKSGAKPKASDKQLSFLRSMMNERAVPADDLAAMEVAIGRGLDSATASKLIDECRSYPKLDVARNEQPLEDGMYRTPKGVIYKVYHTVHGANQQVAKELVNVASDTEQGEAHEFVYVGKRPLKGPDAIQPGWRMTLEQAKEFGAVYGVCCVCARTLTNETSIEAGIGPVCAGRI